MTSGRELELELQLEELLGLVEKAGTALRNHATIVSEHGGTTQDLRGIIMRSGGMGEAMVDAATRTRVKLGLEQ